MDTVRTGISTVQAAEQLLSGKRRGTNAPVRDTGTVSFEQVLLQTRKAVQDVGELKFSKHADARLAERDIRLTENQMLRLNEGADKASAKGIRDSLVILDNLAFIVNTPSRTVITAMDQNYGQDNVYTNIDGAVII